MGLHGVVEERLRPVLGLDDHVRLGQSALEVAALVAAGLLDQLAARDRLVRVEQRLELLPLDLDQPHGLASLRQRVRRDRSHGVTRVAGLVGEDVRVSGADHRPDPQGGARGLEVELPHAGVREGTAQHRGVEHAGEPHVGGVAGLAAGALRAVLPRSRPADDLPRPRRPLLELVLLDDHPGLLVAALDLLLGLDQSRHVRIASSIRGYAPQRQMFPAMWCRISSRLGDGTASTSAAAETIWPGVQKPHWSASHRTKASTSGWPVFAVGAIATWGTVKGAVPIGGATPTESVQILQALVAVVGISCFIMAASIEERDEYRRPIINIVQHIWHACPNDRLYRHRFLPHKAIRICVGPEIARAILRTGRVRGPVFTIPNALEVDALTQLPQVARDIDLIILAQRPHLVDQLIDLAFLALFLSAVAREIFAGKNWRNLPALGGLFLLLIGNAVTQSGTADLAASGAFGNRIGLAVAASMIDLVGGRLIPSFTRNHLAKRGRRRTDYQNEKRPR